MFLWLTVKDLHLASGFWNSARFCVCVCVCVCVSEVFEECVCVCVCVSEVLEEITKLGKSYLENVIFLNIDRNEVIFVPKFISSVKNTK